MKKGSGCRILVIIASAIVVFLSGAVQATRKLGHDFGYQLEAESATLSHALLDHEPPFDQKVDMTVDDITNLLDSSHKILLGGLKHRLANEESQNSYKAQAKQSDDPLTFHTGHLSQRKTENGSESSLPDQDTQNFRLPDSQNHMLLLRRLFSVKTDRADSTLKGVNYMQESSLRNRQSRNVLEKTGHDPSDTLSTTDSSVLDSDGKLQDGFSNSERGNSWDSVSGERDETLHQTKTQRTASGDQAFQDVQRLQRVKRGSGSTPQLIYSIWPDRPPLNMTAYLKMKKDRLLQMEMRQNSYTAFSALSSLLIFIILMMFVLRGWKLQRKAGNAHDALEEPQTLFVNDVVRSRAQYLPMFQNTAVVDMVMVQDRGCDP